MYDMRSAYEGDTGMLGLIRFGSVGVEGGGVSASRLADVAFEGEVGGLCGERN